MRWADPAGGGRHPVRNVCDLPARGSPAAYARAVLRIIDARTGETADAAPARRGLTRVEARASGYDASGLRVLLVADLLVRALELGGTPVWSLLTGDREQAELRAGAEALGIRPFEDSRDLGAALGEAQVVRVAGMGEAARLADTEPGGGGGSGAGGGGAGAGEAARGGPGGGVLVAVAPVEATVTFSPSPSPADADDGGPEARADGGDGPAGRVDAGGCAAARADAGDGPVVSGGPGRVPAASADAAHASVAPGGTRPGASLATGDPAVWRLALLGRRYGQPLRLDERGLEEARRTLVGWRRAVAGWARQPSRPIPDDVRGRLRGAWEDDLDVPAVLRVLEWVATRPDLADGARFETYAYADRLLGLDLTRDIGHAL